MHKEGDETLRFREVMKKVQLIKEPALFYTGQAFKLLKAIKTLRLR